MPHNKKIANVRKKDEKREAQAALDYLMSWGWVLIIIVLVLVILFSLGVFRVPSAPTIISGFKGITMQAAEANSTMMVVKITNNYNQFVNVTGITVNVNGNTYTAYSCLNTIISTGQSTLCRVPVVIPTTSYLSKIQISFTPYKSSIYEVSNGTVSSTLLSGAIPINNQLTYFIERGLPYGSTFTVNYNTSTNSTTVSSIKDNVSFNLPFGNYYFSVPTVTYQGCTSLPNPSAGYHSTGVGEIIAFTSNCTTTFSEKGLPSGQSWQVTFNGTTKSNSTGSNIYITVKNVSSTQVYYTATAKSDNLACVSYKTPSIRLGESYTFSAWNCTTTFSETGLPSGQDWYTHYSSNSPSVSTGSPISYVQDDIPDVLAATSEAYSSNLNCNSYNAPSLYEGSSYTFNYWSCITTFSGQLPVGYDWEVSWNGLTSPSTATQNQIKFDQDLYTVPTNSFSFSSSTSNGLSCKSSGNEVVGESQYINSPSWNCTTTFNWGLPNGYTVGNGWTINFNGVSKSGIVTPLSVSAMGSLTYTLSAKVDSTFYCSTNGYSFQAGIVNTIPKAYWSCITNFSDLYWPPSGSLDWSIIENNSASNSGSTTKHLLIASQPGFITYDAKITSSGYDCYYDYTGNNDVAGTLLYPGIICVTTFTNGTAVPPTTWSVTFNSTTNSTTGTNLKFTSNPPAGYSSAVYFTIPSVSTHSSCTGLETGPGWTYTYTPSPSSGYKPTGVTVVVNWSMSLSGGCHMPPT